MTMRVAILTFEGFNELDVAPDGEKESWVERAIRHVAKHLAPERVEA